MYKFSTLLARKCLKWFLKSLLSNGYFSSGHLVNFMLKFSDGIRTSLCVQLYFVYFIGVLIAFRVFHPDEEIRCIMIFIQPDNLLLQQLDTTKSILTLATVLLNLFPTLYDVLMHMLI